MFDLFTLPSGWLLFSSALLSSTLLPGGSEALLLYLASDAPQYRSGYWFMATLGNTLGGVSSWLIGYFVRWRFPAEPFLAKHRVALKRIHRYGPAALLLSWLPVIGDPLCVAAGWLRVHWLLALLLIGIGKGVRYALLLALL